MEHEEIESFSIAMSAVNDAEPDEDLLAQWRSRAAMLADVAASESATNSVGDELFGRLRLVADDLSRAARKARRLLPSLEREQPIAIADETIVEVEAAEAEAAALPNESARHATTETVSGLSAQLSTQLSTALSAQLSTQLSAQLSTELSALSTQMSAQLSHATSQLTSSLATQLSTELSGLRDVMLNEMSGLAELRQQMRTAAADDQMGLSRSSATLELIAAAEDVIASFPKRRSARTVQRLARLDEQLRTMAALVGLEGVSINRPSSSEDRGDNDQPIVAAPAEAEPVAIC